MGGTMEFTPQTSVAEIATHVPAAIRVFQDYKIDFCCGGGQSLADACASRSLDADVVLSELRDIARGPADGRDWSQASLTDLTAHIQQQFHAPLRRDLPWLGQMLMKVVERHGAAHPETRELQEVFTALHLDLLHHMKKEETVLFPAISALESGGERPNLEVIGALVHEHEETRNALERMRALTTAYVAPEDACPTYRGLYQGLAELDRDIRVHVHLENHVLFPRAAALARA